jgi:hypothetical protein
MKSLPVALLALSLAGNAVLAYLVLSSGSVGSVIPSTAATVTPRVETNAHRTAAASTVVKSTVPASGLQWRSPRTDHDLRTLVSDLRSAGFPGPVVRAVVNQLLTERYAARQPDASLPFWKRGVLTPELLDAQQALNREKQQETEALLGPDARPSAVLDATTRGRRYGGLSDDKVDALVKIERDYNEVQSKLTALRENGVSGLESLSQQMTTVEKEKSADIATLLTPEELKQYEMRNSSSANRLVNNLRKVDINEAEYTALYQLQKAFDTANPQRAFVTAATQADRQAAMLALHEQVRAVLGDDRFFQYAETADFAYANVARFAAKYPAITPAISYQVYQLQTELQGALTRNNTGGGAPNPTRAQELRTLAENYNQRLETLIGHEAAEAYRKDNNGRVFNALRNQPRTAPGAGG